jgi:hypothetical protein
MFEKNTKISGTFEIVLTIYLSFANVMPKDSVLVDSMFNVILVLVLGIHLFPVSLVHGVQQQREQRYEEHDVNVPHVALDRDDHDGKVDRKAHHGIQFLGKRHRAGRDEIGQSVCGHEVPKIPEPYLLGHACDVSCLMLPQRISASRKGLNS